MSLAAHDNATTTTTRRAPAEAIRILTHNCWGLKYLSPDHGHRLLEIGRRIALSSPPLDIVGLQEVWTHADYASIREQTRQTLPYGKFYYSGIFGGGLVILSRWPIEESSMYRYPLNGRPTAFFRGDWFVGKGVACARIRMPSTRVSDGADQGARSQLLEVFNTHLHAPYEREPNDSYICHRTAQAWEIAKLMRHASERGSLVVGLGDFNMVPMSFAHVLIEGRSGGAKDIWRVLRPDSSIGASVDDAERERRRKHGLRQAPSVHESLEEHGHTCDSTLNTWRWTKAQRRELKASSDRRVYQSETDSRAKRLDYIFFGGLERGWKVEAARVSLTDRHPTMHCSLSDHFAVEAEMVRDHHHHANNSLDHAEAAATHAPTKTMLAKGLSVNANGHQIDIDSDTMVEMEEKQPTVGSAPPRPSLLPPTIHTHLTPAFYQSILSMIHTYTLRERRQRRLRLSHFLASCAISIACFVAIWWSPSNYVSLILVLLSSLGLMAGTVDGLIGGLFVGSELRALAEFEWEVRNAMVLAGGSSGDGGGGGGGGPGGDEAVCDLVVEENAVRDWYD